MAQDQQPRVDLGRASVLTRGAGERAVFTIGVAAFFVAGYFGVGRHVDPGKSLHLGTIYDARIPFIASSVWVYLYVFPASLLPLFVVRSPALFRRTLAAYAVAIAVSLIVFAAWPVTSIGLRVDRNALDATHFSGWAVDTLYRLDPPVNLFPSLHLSIAMLAALSARKARTAYGACAFAGVALIALSIVTVKQHFIVDGLGGLVLAAAVYAIVLRKYAPPPGSDPAYGWRGPAAFGLLLVAAYAGLYCAFLASS